MRRIRVVTDSTADIDESRFQRLGISVVPLNVHLNGDTYQDKLEISIDEFYRRLREEKVTPKTSQPSVGLFEDAYRRLLEDADGIVSTHISSKLSGTCNSAQVAAKNVAPDKIAVVDSTNTTYCLGLLVAKVAEFAEQGVSLKECVDYAEELIPRLRLIGCLDTLEFLRRGGRIGRAQAFAGHLLSIKLVFQVMGEVLPVERVRTRATAIKRLSELIGDLGPVDELAVLYGDDPEPAKQLKELLMGHYPDTEIDYGRIGPVLGTHAGPGVFGACALLSK